MRIVVIGRHGQLARALAHAEGAHHHDLLHLARPEIDLERPESLPTKIADLGPDIVINAAAYTHVDTAETEPERARTINAIAAGQIAAGAMMADAPVIQVSTDYVFDGTLGRAYLETDPVAPLGVYGRTKFEGEQLAATANARHIIARTARVYSPWGNNFVKTMLHLGAERDRLSIIGDQVGNPTSAEDLADALLAIADGVVDLPADSHLWGIYNVAGGGTSSWYEFADEIFRVAAAKGLRVPTLTPITSAEYPSAAQRPVNSRLNCGRLKTEMAISLPAWRDALRKTMETLLDGQ